MEVLKVLLFMGGTFFTQMLEGTLAAAANTPRDVDVSTRSEALEKTIALGKSQNEVTDRDMHQDWEEFRKELTRFEAKFDDLICTEPHLLLDIHENMAKLSQKVKLAWELKQQQLKDLTVILVHENYTETGLASGDVKVADACNGLHYYITKAKETAFDEKTELDKHLKEVEDEKFRLDTHPCPCIWAAWSEWDSCSKSCGDGTRTSTRNIEKEAKNNGTACHGKFQKSESCHLKHCPIDCVWGEWKEWDTCPSGCKNGVYLQEKTRTRKELVEAEHGGKQCVDKDYQKKDCTLEQELNERIKALLDEKKALEESYKELEDACNKESTNPSACRDGYEYTPGDVRGGPTSGQHADIASNDVCGQKCDETSSCCSYQWSPSKRTCNLYTACKPNNEKWEDFEFCSKKNKGPSDSVPVNQVYKLAPVYEICPEGKALNDVETCKEACRTIDGEWWNDIDEEDMLPGCFIIVQVGDPFKGFCAFNHSPPPFKGSQRAAERTRKICKV